MNLAKKKPSIEQQIRQLESLLESESTSESDFKFIWEVADKSEGGTIAANLSKEEVERVEKLYRENFA